MKFLQALAHAFGRGEGDITEVHIDAPMIGSSIARETRVVRQGR